MASAGFRKLPSAIGTEETALTGVEAQFQTRQAAQCRGGFGSARRDTHHLAVIADGLIPRPASLALVGGPPWVGRSAHPRVVVGRVRDGPPAFVGNGQRVEYLFAEVRPRAGRQEG